MPIHIPGKRDRKNRKVGASKRSVVAVLSLTAMVDMFTVLAVFLLQNYATTDQILHMPDKVALPQARAIKELKPSNVVIVDKDGVMLNNEQVASLDELKAAEDWMIQRLKRRVEELIKKGEQDKKALGQRLKIAVSSAKNKDGNLPPEIDPFRKMTIQADKVIDFLSVKKVMYTVTEAGVFEINFAVLEEKRLEEN